MLKPALHYLEMSWVIVYMRHCCLCYIDSFLILGPYFSLDLISLLRVYEIDGGLGIPLVSLAALLATVGVSNTCLAEKVGRAAGI